MDKSMVFGLAVAVALLAGPAAAEKAEATRFEKKVDRFLGGELPAGFYTYLYRWKQWKDPEATDLDEALAEMSRRGSNVIYAGALGRGQCGTDCLNSVSSIESR